MKILEITVEPIMYGGQERFITNLIRYGADDETHFDVLTPYFCTNEGFRSIVEERGGQVGELGLAFRPGKSKRFLLEPLTDYIKANDYDVVHIHSGSTLSLTYGALAARRAGVKKVVVHSHIGGDLTIKRRIVKTVYGRLLRRCNVEYLACSMEAAKARFTDEVIKSRVEIIPNGIDVDLFSFSCTDRTQHRSMLGIDQEAFVIGHVGRFEKEKNHTFLLETFKAIHESMPDARLLLVGDGSLLESVKQRTESMGISNVVIFTGNVDDVPDMYQTMDVFAFPSWQEGLPFAVVEAQVSGLPCVISSNISEETVIGKNVVRVDLDRDQWVQAITDFRGTGRVDNSEAIRSAGFDIMKTVTIIKNIYKQ